MAHARVGYQYKAHAIEVAVGPLQAGHVAVFHIETVSCMSVIVTDNFSLHTPPPSDAASKQNTRLRRLLTKGMEFPPMRPPTSIFMQEYLEGVRNQGFGV